MFTVSCLQFLGQAASIADMCITPDEFLQRVGDFGQYCPVSLADKNELIDCSTNVTLKFAAEFRGIYTLYIGCKYLHAGINSTNVTVIYVPVLNYCINNTLVHIYTPHAQKTYKMIIITITMILLSQLLV